jgi:hypothetical protein
MSKWERLSPSSHWKANVSSLVEILRHFPCFHGINCAQDQDDCLIGQWIEKMVVRNVAGEHNFPSGGINMASALRIEQNSGLAFCLTFLPGGCIISQTSVKINLEPTKPAVNASWEIGEIIGGGRRVRVALKEISRDDKECFKSKMMPGRISDEFGLSSPARLHKDRRMQDRFLECNINKKNICHQNVIIIHLFSGCHKSNQWALRGARMSCNSRGSMRTTAHSSAPGPMLLPRASRHYLK